MKKLILISLCVIAAASCQTMHSNAATKSVVGAWELVAWEDRDPDGAVTKLFGDHPKGMSILDAKGYLSVQVTSDLAASDKASTGTYFAYFGRYELDFSNLIATITVERGLGVPAGHVFKIPFQLEGDVLTLMPRYKSDDGKEMTGIRRLRKRP